MDLHPAGERKPVRGGKRENARQPPKRAVSLDSHRVPIFKGFRDAPFLPPAEMRTVRTLLRIGGCLDHHDLAPAIHGRATEESVRYRQPDTAAPATTTPSSSGITYEEYLRLKEQKQQHHEHE